MAMGVAVAADLVWHLASGVAGLLLVVAVWVFYFVWWTPRQLERALRAQGLDGTSYRFPHGDRELSARLDREVHAKPMTFSHSIIPRVAPFTHRTVSQYGKISFTWAGPVPEVTITDVGLVRQLLLNMSHDFEKPKLNPLAKFFFRGVFTYEGEKWAKHRRILNPAFHMEKLKQMLPAFRTCCNDLISKWENMVGSGTCYEFDVWSDLQTFAANVISTAALGTSYEEGKRVYQIQTQQIVPFVQAAQSLNVPGSEFLPAERKKRIKALDREIRELLGSIIKKREEDIKNVKASNGNLLGLLLESTMTDSQEHGNNNAGMTIEEVIEECKLFYFAGQETSAVLLTWTMILLSMHPEWQVRAREEVLRVFGENKPDFDGLSRLKTVTMILHEVLRLYPPITFIQRHTYKTIKLGDVNYPPGVLLRLPILFFNHDPEIWGEDASEFNPERFAEGVSNACKNHQMVFFPFGGGPRNCIGQNFALMEAKMALAAILQHFSFELSPAYAHAPLIVLSLVPQHGAHLRLRRF
ncbi:hypothetical protein OPV22_014249 [Ensete ventricosum]|uniref:Cytochrome P450 n=1 Tax=Ensete ventricosum TaxID=4639 RepID=A0AAV8R2U6_ENSVE|nr:hypothetical protein OPV22_014249 [Ensete ventricosum]